MLPDIILKLLVEIFTTFMGFIFWVKTEYSRLCRKVATLQKLLKAYLVKN